MVVGLSEKLNSSIGTAVVSNIGTSGRVSVGQVNEVRECDFVRKGIERSEKLIKQIICTCIPTDYVDIALIRKCNTIDLPALQSASKACEKSLLKYLLFSDVDNAYSDRVSVVLDQAEEWVTGVVAAYTATEIHSFKGSPGDIADVGVFSDNADKTVFEFLETFEFGYINWGNNPQCASKLLKHLSNDLKDKVMSQSDSYALMREWLISNYGAPAWIVNDTVMALVKRKQPTASDRADKYAYVSAIIAGLQ